MSEREIVTMLVEPHTGNAMGEVRIYRDELPMGAVVKEDKGVPAIAHMNKTQLIALLENRGIELIGGETKAELVALALSE